MVIHFLFHICTAKTFLKALNVLFAVVWILIETTMRHYAIKCCQLVQNLNTTRGLIK